MCSCVMCGSGRQCGIASGWWTGGRWPEWWWSEWRTRTRGQTGHSGRSLWRGRRTSGTQTRWTSHCLLSRRTVSPPSLSSCLPSPSSTAIKTLSVKWPGNLFILKFLLRLTRLCKIMLDNGQLKNFLFPGKKFSYFLRFFFLVGEFLKRIS